MSLFLFIKQLFNCTIYVLPTWASSGTHNKLKTKLIDQFIVFSLLCVLQLINQFNFQFFVCN